MIRCLLCSRNEPFAGERWERGDHLSLDTVVAIKTTTLSNMYFSYMEILKTCFDDVINFVMNNTDGVVEMVYKTSPEETLGLLPSYKSECELLFAMIRSQKLIIPNDIVKDGRRIYVRREHPDYGPVEHLSTYYIR